MESGTPFLQKSKEIRGSQAPVDGRSEGLMRARGPRDRSRLPSAALRERRDLDPEDE